MNDNSSLSIIEIGEEIIKLVNCTTLYSDIVTVSAITTNKMEELVNSSLDTLKFEDKELLVLNMYCGYRFDEIATMMGMSPNAIWTRASRARAQLRDRVKSMIKRDNQT